MNTSLSKLYVVQLVKQLWKRKCLVGKYIMSKRPLYSDQFWSLTEGDWIFKPALNNSEDRPRQQWRK